MTHVFYSFLTLAKVPSPSSPPVAYWDGLAIYESMTQADIMTVLATPQMNSAHGWQRTKMEAIMKNVKDSGKKWIWAIGGWSDLTKTIRAD